MHLSILLLIFCNTRTDTRGVVSKRLYYKESLLTETNTPPRSLSSLQNVQYLDKLMRSQPRGGSFGAAALLIILVVSPSPEKLASSKCRVLYVVWAAETAVGLTEDKAE